MNRPLAQVPSAQEAILHSTNKEKTANGGEGNVFAEARKHKTKETSKTQFETKGQRKKRNEWTRQEDDILLSLVQTIKNRRPHERIWQGIANRLNEQVHSLDDDPKKRSSKDCRERWNDTLDPNLNKEPWTQREKEIVETMYKSFGPKWATMAAHSSLKGRSVRDIKNIWHSMMNTKQKKQSANSIDSASSIAECEASSSSGISLLAATATRPEFPPTNFSLHPIQRPTVAKGGKVVPNTLQSKRICDDGCEKVDPPQLKPESRKCFDPFSALDQFGDNWN